MVRSNDIVGKAVTDSFQISVDYVEKHADLVSSAVTDTNVDINLVKKRFYKKWLELFEKSARQKVEEPLVHLHCLFKRR